MIFVIDVGNTNIVMGVYRNAVLVRDWRVRTERNREFSTTRKPNPRHDRSSA